MADVDHGYPVEDGGRMRHSIHCKTLPVYECAIAFGGLDGFQSANRVLWMLMLTVTKLRLLEQDPWPL